MSRAPVEKPVVDAETGRETHPAWGLIGMHRVQVGPPGATLFDSDVQHGHTVRIALHAADRSRDLHRDHIMANRASIFEVEMSEAQWAAFVASGNMGDGVACTIRRREYAEVPGVPAESRLRESIEETREAANEAFQEIREAFKLVEEKPTKANIRNLRFKIENAPANVAYAAKSLTEHAENVGQKLRADVEAMVVAGAKRLGVSPEEFGTLALNAGDEEPHLREDGEELPGPPPPIGGEAND